MDRSAVLRYGIGAALIAGNLLATPIFADAATESVVHVFGSATGTNPVAALIKVGSKFYGTAMYGGTGKMGTVFSMTAAGHVTVLHSFSGGSDGADPMAELLNVNGTLYGTTNIGGGGAGCTFGCGNVFKVSTQGQYSSIYSFQGGTDGIAPEAGLINVGGMLYGTTEFGGTTGNGAVFQITPQGVEKVIYSFQGKADGGWPVAHLTNIGTTLYGTTSNFGAACNCGTVFKITPSGNFSVVHTFLGSDGSQPAAPLLNVGGVLYGTTVLGGAGRGVGTVFSVTPQGAEKVLWSFGNTQFDGDEPFAGLTYFNNTFYGTTSADYAEFHGTVFSLTLQGVEKVLYTFPAGAGGWYPVAGVTELNGALFGTTENGGRGQYGGGIAFKVIP